MVSLKSFLPRISGHLRVSPAALYERQRALVRLGILRGEEGRGPGSGVKLSADALAAMLASLLLTDNLSEVDERVGVLLKARSSKVRTTFGKALSDILSKMVAHGWRIAVERQTLEATIERDQKEELVFSSVPLGAHPGYTGIITMALIHPETMSSLIKTYQSAVSEEVSHEESSR
jgi:hypothetical protein